LSTGPLTVRGEDTIFHSSRDTRPFTVSAATLDAPPPTPVIVIDPDPVTLRVLSPAAGNVQRLTGARVTTPASRIGRPASSCAHTSPTSGDNSVDNYFRGRG